MHPWVLLLALVPLSGCLGPGTTLCDGIEGAQRSTQPYDFGVALYTKRDATVVEAWACNESNEERYLLLREGDCPGSWTWTYQAPGAEAATHQWPEGGNYAECNSWLALAPGRGDKQWLALDVEPEAGGEWRIRLQVYTQPEVLLDSGGGPVHAVYMF